MQCSAKALTPYSAVLKQFKGSNFVQCSFRAVTQNSVIAVTQYSVWTLTQCSVRVVTQYSIRKVTPYSEVLAQ